MKLAALVVLAAVAAVACASNVDSAALEVEAKIGDAAVVAQDQLVQPADAAASQEVPAEMTKSAADDEMPMDQDAAPADGSSVAQAAEQIEQLAGQIEQAQEQIEQAQEQLQEVVEQVEQAAPEDALLVQMSKNAQVLGAKELVRDSDNNDSMLKATDDLDALLQRLENDDSFEALAKQLDQFEMSDYKQSKAAEQNPGSANNLGSEKAADDEFPLFDDLVFEDIDEELEGDDLFMDAMDEEAPLASGLEERANPTPGYEIQGMGGDGMNNWGGVYNTTVILEPGDGWVEFLFNGTGTNVTSTFIAFSPDQALVLYLTDIGCSGDMFAVYDNGVFIGASSMPTVNNCTTVISDPSVAYVTPGYSTFSSVLAAGVNHVITLQMVASPYGGGTGAIQVNFNLNTCTVPGTGISIITEPLPHNETDVACDGIGMRPLDVTIFNFANATQVLFDCLGAYANAYIGSYWGNTYMDSPLALWVSWILPGGAIAPTLSGDLPLPIMCQNKTYFTTYSDSDSD